MRFALLALLTLAGFASAQCPPGGCKAPPKAAAPAMVWAPELGAWVQVMPPAPVQFVAVPPPPPPRIVAVPAAPVLAVPAVPVYAVAPPPKKFPTPIRDFFFGRH